MPVEPVIPLKFRYRVRWIAGLTVLSLLLFGIRSWKTHTANERLRTVARIEQRRVYLFPFPELFSSSDRERLLPKLYVIEGIHFHPGTENPGQYLREVSLATVKKIGFQHCKMGPQDSSALEGNSTITEISFELCDLPAGTLRAIRDLPALTRLSIGRSTIEQSDSLDLTTLPKLQQIHMGLSKCSDQFLSEIRKSPRKIDLDVLQIRLLNRK